MNVWEENRYPWLVKEKLFIKNWVLNLEKPFFGICLGHQLLGEALGASVVKSQTPEIGFKEISVSRKLPLNNLFRNFLKLSSNFNKLFPKINFSCLKIFKLK